MEVNFTPETQETLNRAADANKSSAADYVQQLVEHYLEHDVWFRQQVRDGLDQLDRGESLTQEEVSERIRRMFRP